MRLLVVSQLAASFLLLIGAGLLTRSLMQLYAVLRDQQTRDALKQFNDQVLERVKAEGSVKNAAVASAAPLAGSFP